MQIVTFKNYFQNEKLLQEYLCALVLLKIIAIMKMGYRSNYVH